MDINIAYKIYEGIKRFDKIRSDIKTMEYVEKHCKDIKGCGIQMIDNRDHIMYSVNLYDSKVVDKILFIINEHFKEEEIAAKRDIDKI